MSITIENLICNICLKLALTDCIYCDLCNTWIHRNCLKLTKQTLNILSKSSLSYFCKTCLCGDLPFMSVTNSALDNIFSKVPSNQIIECSLCNNQNKNIKSQYCQSYTNQTSKNTLINKVKSQLFSQNQM